MNKNPQKHLKVLAVCAIFHLTLRALDGWSNHVFEAEHLFLENIYSAKHMKLMGIENFKLYSEKLDKILDKLDDFCESIECGSSISMKNEWVK